MGGQCGCQDDDSRIVFEPFIVGDDGEFQLVAWHFLDLKNSKEVPIYYSRSDRNDVVSLIN